MEIRVKKIEVETTTGSDYLVVMTMTDNMPITVARSVNQADATTLKRMLMTTFNEAAINAV